MQASGSAQANRGEKADANLTVREALQRANKAIDVRFEDRPLTNARIRDCGRRNSASSERLRGSHRAVT